MSGATADNGSKNVTIIGVESTAIKGLYAPDGSIRITIIG